MPLIIRVETADASLWLDRLLMVLVVVLMAAAWWLETPYNLLWLAFFGALAWGVPRLLFGARRAADAASLRHQTMNALDGSRRQYNPSSLCAQARSPLLHKPWALRVSADGTLSCCWTAESPWVPVENLQILRLGPLLQLRFRAPGLVGAAAGFSSPIAGVSQTGRASATVVVAGPASQAQPVSSLTESVPGGQNAPLACGVESGTTDPITYAAPTSTESAASALMTEVPSQQQPVPAMQHAACLLWMPRLPADEAAALRRWLLWRQRGGQ